MRDDKTLTRYDVSNGNCLESVFLSSKRKFMELRLDAGRPNITVKSTQKSGFCNEDSCDHKKCNKTCIAFITFSYPRLKFLAHLEISQEAFGATLKNAVICDGFIIAIHANKTAKLYSLDYVLNKYMQQSYKIGESRSSQRMSCEESAIFLRKSCIHGPFDTMGCGVIEAT